ncbi:MAG: hypothetical protein M1832_003685 [Thelocarpon impressellum]|nr:MAG: hypothetical protein M1832_003685 [Thelocarpon impressellum]
MAPSNLLSLFLVALTFDGLVIAHGSHDQIPISDTADWATRHMAEEHHIGNFDPGAFFSLHDFDSSLDWSADEIARTYGLADEELLKSLGQKKLDEKHEEVVREVMQLLDHNRDGKVQQSEWLSFCAAGRKLPDFGLGPGHHGDDEYEYEIHHFEKFHDENTKEEDLIHPEDIAHFAKHDREADAAEEQERRDALPIVDGNIPAKFRRSG